RFSTSRGAVVARNKARSALFCAVVLALGATAPLGAASASAASDGQRRGLSPDQAGEIAGVVRDGAGGFLRGAEVRVQGMDVVAVTDSEGRFVLRRVPEGTHVLVYSYVGRPPRQETVVVTAGRTADASVVVGQSGLAGDVATLDGVQVRASRP